MATHEEAMFPELEGLKSIEELCEEMCKAELRLNQLGSFNRPLDYEKRIAFDVQYQIARDDWASKSDRYYAAIREKAKREAV